MPLPPSLGSLDGTTGTVTSLEELASGNDMLALVVSTEGIMTDPLRQTLVGLSQAPLENAGVAAVSLVSGKTYRSEFVLADDVSETLWCERKRRNARI